MKYKSIIISSEKTVIKLILYKNHWWNKWKLYSIEGNNFPDICINNKMAKIIEQTI